jgi:hypothetical protein
LLQNGQGQLRTIGRAFGPPISQLPPETQADGLGWYIGAPLALSSAGVLEEFPARIAILLGVRPIHAIALLWDGVLASPRCPLRYD